MTQDAVHARAVDAFIAAANASDPQERGGLLSRALSADGAIDGIVVFAGPLG